MCHDIIYPRKGESLTMQSNGIGNVSARGMQIQAVNGGVVEKVIIGSGYRNTELSQILGGILTLLGIWFNIDFLCFRIVGRCLCLWLGLVLSADCSELFFLVLLHRLFS